MHRLLFVCRGNCCRSQMAEAIWNHCGPKDWRAFSAGTHPAGFVHELASEVLRELRIPVFDLSSKSVDEFSEQSFELVISLCETDSSNCLNWPTSGQTLHWPFDDPAKAGGSPREQMVVFRRVRDEIRWQIQNQLQLLQTDGESNRPMALDDATRYDGEAVIAAALREDLGPFGLDATSEAVVPDDAHGTAALVARRAGVICGLPFAESIARRFEIDLKALAQDGQRVAAMQTIAVMRGNSRRILTAERTCLNLMSRLSGIATLAAEFVDRVRGTGAVIVDTRKTTPGWRRLEKYAVRCGGGQNHRMGLYDAILIKDNHLALLRRSGDDPLEYLVAAIHSARRWIAENAAKLPHGRRTMVQTEIDSLSQLAAALDANPDSILLDNFSVEQLQEAVRRRDQAASKVLLEASGGVRLETVTAIARSGVERISVGAMTHSAPILDLALDWEPPSAKDP